MQKQSIALFELAAIFTHLPTYLSLSVSVYLSVSLSLAMAATLERTFLSLRNPNHYISDKLPRSRPMVITPRRLDLAQSQPATWRRTLHVDRCGLPRLVALAASREDSKPDFGSAEKKDETEIKLENSSSQETWKESLEYFKSEALKLKSMSQEVYEIYSKKATVALLELSEKLKIQADKAQRDLNRIAKEVSVEGQQYLSTVAENSPESTKDVAEVFKSVSQIKNLSEIKDYHVGVVYGSYLAVGGFLWFMLTGSISAVRFGLILGWVLVALGLSSLQSRNSGRSSPFLLKAQTTIATVIFLRDLAIFCLSKSFVTLIRILISGTALGLYVFGMLTGGQSKGPTTTQQSSEN